MQNLYRQMALPMSKSSEENCSFLSNNLQHTWDEFCFKRSFIGVIEKYMATVETMESTILVPSRLMGLPMKEILPESNFDGYLERLDMRAFFAYMKAVKIQMALGCSFIHEEDERNSPFQCKLREATNQINQVVLIAKFVTIFAQNIAFRSRTLTYKEFENNVRFTKNPTLYGSLKELLTEVDEMEKAVLFPCLLKDHGIVDDLPKFSNSSSPDDNLHEVFTLLKLLKNEILSGPQETIKLLNENLHVVLSELYDALPVLTSLTASLTQRYKQEVQCI